jgi:hypothetical protein
MASYAACREWILPADLAVHLYRWCKANLAGGREKLSAACSPGSSDLKPERSREFVIGAAVPCQSSRAADDQRSRQSATTSPTG